MKVKKTITLKCSFEAAVDAVKKSSLLYHVSYPLVVFEPVSGSFPEKWISGTHWAKLKFFGVVPLGNQAIVISFEPHDTKFIMHDRGYSALIQKWHHTITIELVSKGVVRYKDEIEIQAGLITPLIWIFASFFYRHRQNRWVQLCAQNFRQIE